MLLFLLLPTVLAYSPDWYPTPEIGTVSNDWTDALAQSMSLLAQLTLPEKVNITTGTGWEGGQCVGNTGSVPRLGIKGLCLQDGPLGVRFADFVTVFPCQNAMAATFDRILVHQRGTAIGTQSRLKGVDVHLGPVVGPLGRHATAGRNWEGFSPDPYLSGKLAFEAILGVQEQGVLATIKHFIGNEQEHYRRAEEWIDEFGFTNLKQALSSNIDDRTLHEMYMWPFADAVRANVGAVMCSYNEVNGSQACQNSHLLNGKLKSELGFQGFVMSDWFAQGNGVANALAGMDMSMPGNDVDEFQTVYWGEQLTRMVSNGTLSESRLDDMVLRILTPLIYFGIDDRSPNFASFNDKTVGSRYPAAKRPEQTSDEIINFHLDVRDQFAANVALESARGAIVLMVNDGILPLKDVDAIGVFGVGSRLGAVCENMQCSEGALIEGWGSGTAYPTEYQSPYEALHTKASLLNVAVTGTTESWDMRLPLELAGDTDVNIVYVLSNSGEATASVDKNIGDRNNVSLWHNGDELINAVASQGKTVVVITTVGQVDMSSWLNHPNVSAVLLTAPAGDYGGKAMADVLFGEVNPSGKLPYTIAEDPSDYIPIVSEIPPDGAPQSDFVEGIYLDYRWYDKMEKLPLYEFGYGLSYSNFSFSNMTLDVQPISEFLPPRPEPVHISKPQPRPITNDDLWVPKDFHMIDGLVYPWIQNVSVPADDPEHPFIWANGAGHVSDASGGVGGHPWLWSSVATVTHTTTNTGSVAGRVVSQLYVSFPQTLIDTPPVQLRGFDKSKILSPGESQTTQYNLQWRDLAIWDVELQSWRVQRGEYTVYIGHSSRVFEVFQTFSV
ncbi:putative beta-glucosidase A [Yarrowia sp. C11]|nr:putative beta-glucosidase A [Yarrowia sp. C11]KAG5364313.1 putative beta-glucosidase A [Yarrowia sp. E02]